MLSCDGIHALHHTLFPPTANPRGTLLIIHGMAEHSGRYVAFAHYMASQDYAVLTYDQLGHGRTASSPDGLGHFAKPNSSDLLVGDGRQMAEWLAKQYPDLPHFILGHSMGSFVVRCVLQEIGSSFTGAVLVGSAGTAPSLRTTLPLLKGLAKFGPAQRADKIHGLFGQASNFRFRSEQDPLAWLSVSHDNRQRFSDDPLCGQVFTRNGFYTLLSLADRAVNHQWYLRLPKDLPMLWTSGDQDPVGHFSLGIHQTTQTLKTQGFSKISSQLYPGWRHDILQEADKEQVYHNLSQWFEQQL